MTLKIYYFLLFPTLFRFACIFFFFARGPASDIIYKLGELVRRRAQIKRCQRDVSRARATNYTWMRSNWASPRPDAKKSCVYFIGTPKRHVRAPGDIRQHIALFVLAPKRCSCWRIHTWRAQFECKNFSNSFQAERFLNSRLIANILEFEIKNFWDGGKMDFLGIKSFSQWKY